MIKEVGDEHPTMLIVHFTFSESECLQSGCSFESFPQKSAVSGGEFKQVPSEVHPTVEHSGMV